jgi:uncharacterized protein (TIGR03083 family)
MTTALSPDLAWQAIDDHRVRIADLLDGLTDDQWRQPSLCTGWTVHDVAAHLTLQQLTWRQALTMMVRYRGDIDRAVHESAKARAAELPPRQTAALIRGMAGSRRHNAGVTYRETLIDALVHGQDIALALGCRLPVPAGAAAEATRRMWTMRFPPPFPATRIMREFRLTATDTDWAMGRGPEVHGPIAAIMLVSSGRLAALPALTGPGATELTARLQPA